jgi:DNA-binding SARP family transcriptional activator
MTPLRMSVLGGFEIHSRTGTPIQLPPKKARALLAYLALGEPRPQPRDRLAALLWEDSSESQARTSLRQALTAIRRALDEAGSLLDADTETVWLRRDGIAIDADLFRQCASAASTERLREAAEIYRGHLLDGFDVRAPAFEDWLRAERERLRNLAVGALSTLVDHQLAAANHNDALLHATRLLALDPLREETHRVVMRIHAAQSRHAQAIEQYRRAREALRLELGVNPAPETEQLYREIVEQRRTPATATREDTLAEPVDIPAHADFRPQLRHATVWLADIEGFTAFAGETDPEDLHDFLVRYRQMVSSRVAEQGGIVTNYIQARMMAVFGVPIAYGNDSERAVRAALAVREGSPQLENAPGKSMHVRIGVASGPVLAGRDESGFIITGEPVSVAARIMEGAPGDEVRIAGDVRDAVGERLVAQHLPDASVPALRKPLLLWRAVGFELPPGEGRVFVGREAELRQLEDLLAASAGSASGRTILIRGDAGIGKSRLAEELARSARERGFATHIVAIHEFGSTQTHPVVALCRNLLGISVRADADALSFAVRRALDGDIVAPDLQQCLAEMLGAIQRNEARQGDGSAEGAGRVRGRHAVLASLLGTASSLKPLLIVIEDVHWADPTTLDYLSTVAAAGRGASIVLVMTTRTEADPIGNSWRAASGGCPFTTIDLGPLTDTEALQFANRVSTDAEFARNCVARAGGNPLFLDQLLRTGEAPGALPGSLQSLVLARLDRLPQREREALQAAAVLGQRFPIEALRSLLGDEHYSPDPLVEQGLLRTEIGDYVFAHALIQEAVYGSVLKSRRFDLHAGAARWFSQRDPILEAQHLGAAGHPGAAAAFLRAARDLAASYLTRRALDLVSRGLGFAFQEGDRCDLLLVRGEALRDMGESERSIQAFGEALHLAQNDAQRCRAWTGIAAGLRIIDRYDRALAALDHAEPLARALGDSRALMHIHSLRGNIHFPRGDIEGCLAAHEEARRLALEIGAPSEEARALGGLGDAHYQAARIRTARDYFERCIQIARQHGLARVEAMNLPMLGITSFYCGEPRSTVRLCREALDHAIRIGDFRAELLAYDVQAGALYYLGDHESSLNSAERTLELTRRIGARRFEAEALVSMALNRHALDAGGEIDELLDQAWRIVEEIGPNYNGPWVQAAIALVSRDGQRRRDALAKGEQLLAQGCVSHNYFHYYQHAIDVALDMGDWNAAERYASALADYTAREPLPWTDLISARGRTLARFGRGERSASVKQELCVLAQELSKAGLEPATRQLLAAANSA